MPRPIYCGNRAGSLAEGTIFTIGRDGSVVPFIRDADLVSSVGIEADEPRDRLLVTNSDRAVFGDQTAAGHAKLGIYNLTTGERLAMVDLGATVATSVAAGFVEVKGGSFEAKAR